MKVISIILYASFSIVVLSQYNTAIAGTSQERAIDTEIEALDSQRQMHALLDMEPRKSLADDAMTDHTTKSMTLDTLPRSPLFYTQEMIDQDLSKSLQTTLVPDEKMIEEDAKMIKENAKIFEGGNKAEMKSDKKPIDKWALATNVFEQMFYQGLY